jgi:hypothetical protein
VQKKLPYYLLSLAALWIVFITWAITYSNKFELGTGSGYIDQGIRFLKAVSQSGFSPVEFLSIEFWSIYVTIFLAALGAFGGLFRLYGKIRVVSKKDFSAERRQNVLLLACAAISTVILGTTTVLSSVRKRYLLQKFYILEVHLVRFEGLMFNSLAISANHKLIDTFLAYMFGYYSRIEGLLDEISRSYDFTDKQQISLKMEEFSSAVTKLRERGYVDNEDVGDFGDKGDETLFRLLTDLEFMQETVRRHIRGLER